MNTVKTGLQSRRHGDVDYRYSADWIHDLEEKHHWEFYWHQQKLMSGLIRPDKSESILEIGVGTGFAANYCRSKGLNVTTLDIDGDKCPDIHANAVTYDFPERYDHVMAFEVLEHIPYGEFEKLILKLSQTTRRYLFVSLPRNERYLFRLNCQIPKFWPISLEWKVPRGKLRCDTHHWELDYREFTTRRVKKLFADAGLEVRRELACRYIRFFALEIT